MPEGPRRILILENDPDRTQRFRATVALHHPAVEVNVWADARSMMSEVVRSLANALLISLDHDLESASLEHDPGDGLEVAQFLAFQPPACPVIVHSSNAKGAWRMLGALELGGWTAISVAPIGADWIERDWSDAVCLAQRPVASRIAGAGT